MRPGSIVLATILALTFAIAGPVLAGEWHQSVSVSSTVDYDSNLLMSPTNNRGVTRAIISPSYNLIGTYGVDEYKAGLGLRIERSSDQMISMDREDPNLLLDWHRQTETGGFGLVARYDQASSRQSQLEETGTIVQDSTRTTWSLGGDWRTAINERNTLSTNAEYKSVKFDGGNQTNYENLSAGVTWGYAWSERIEPFIQATASHYAPERKIVPTSDNYTLQAGAKVKLAENWNWSVQGGISQVATSHMSDNGWTGTSALRYAGLRHEYAFDVGRTVAASGEGGFVQTDQVKGAWSYAYDELTRLGLDASWRKSQGLQPNTMKQAGAWVSHELSPFWNARLYYQHKQRLQEGLPSASADVLGVTLVYSHPDF